MRRILTIVAALAAAASADAAAQQPEQQQPPIHSTAPFPNRANEVMPSWLRVRGEFRERFEEFTHAGFTPDRNDSYFLSRLRVNAAVIPGRLFSAWAAASRFVGDLPSPVETWRESRLYVLEPLTKRGEMDQGILLLAYYSLVRVTRGFLLGIAIATPLGFLLGVSPALTRMFDPVMQVLRPISPLAWLPLGLIIFQKSEPAALFAIAVCSMWPTVINTIAGVRAIPQDYWNVANVLRLSRTTTFLKIVVPATLPYVFTGYRLSLGIAWLVIVASEMLTGTPGVGGFLWQEYNSLVYAHILLAIVTIGVIGFLLDRLMGVAEARLRTT
jgi:nitrate/nitrite transport system permease protein